MIIEKVERIINDWPWASFLVPTWAVAMIIRAIFVLLMPAAYLAVPAYEVMYNIAPWWLWAIIYLIVNVGVLVQPKNVMWQIFQATLTLMVGVAIFFASIGAATVSPTAGITYLAVAGALWLAMVRNINHVRTPYDTIVREKVKREDDK